MRNLVFIQSKSQLENYQRLIAQADDELYVIEQTSLLEGLSSGRYLLHEGLLSERWKEINEWAQETALTWFQLPAIAPLVTFQGINLADSCFHAICYDLILIAKNMAYFEYVFKRSAGCQPVVLNDKAERNSQLALQHQLRAYLKSKLILFKDLDFESLGAPKDLKSSVKESFKQVLARLGHRFSGVHPDSQIISSGSLTHLGPILRKLSSDKVFHYAHDFSFDDYRRCRAQDYGYVQGMRCLSADDYTSIKKFSDEFITNRDILIEEILKNNVLKLKGFDYCYAVDVFVDSLFQHFKNIIPHMLAFKKTLLRYNPRILLLDEDRGFRRAFAKTWQQFSSNPPIVISHGLPTAIIDAKPHIRNAGVGISIVQSDYEKAKYLQRGYSEDILRVFGVPRFDEINKFRGQTMPPLEKPNFLYCVPRLVRKQRGFLGLHSNLSGDATYQDMEAVLKAARKADVLIKIKPHYIENQSEFLRLFRTYKKWHRLVPFNAKLYPLLFLSKAVLCSYSTVAIEAMLMHRHAGILNLRTMPHIHPFERSGIVSILRSPQDLDRFFSERLADKTLEAVPTDIQAYQYFCGFDDGRSTDRVCSFIKGGLRNNASFQNAALC